MAGNIAAQAGSAGSQLSLAAWATRVLCLKPLGLVVPFRPSGFSAPPGSLCPSPCSPSPFAPLLSAPRGEGMALGLGFAAAAFSHTSLPPGCPSRADGHMGTWALSHAPGMPGSHLGCVLCPCRVPREQQAHGAAPGTWPGWHPRPGDAVTPRGWTISKCLHVQDMNQPGQERSSRSGTPGAAPEAARAAPLPNSGRAGGRPGAAAAPLPPPEQPRARQTPGLACISLFARLCSPGAEHGTVAPGQGRA